MTVSKHFKKLIRTRMAETGESYSEAREYLRERKSNVNDTDQGTRVRVAFKPQENERFPLYCKYPGQIFTQPAYISLNVRTGEIDAGYNPNGAGTMTFDVYHKIELQFPIDCYTTSDSILEIIESNLVEYQTIVDGSSIDWDGNNYVANYDESAESIIDEFISKDAEDPHEYHVIDEEGFEEWIGDDCFPSPTQSIEDYVLEVLACDGPGVVTYLSDELNSASAIESQLLNLWFNRLYNDYDIPPHVARYMLKQDQSMTGNGLWRDELKSFASSITYRLNQDGMEYLKTELAKVQICLSGDDIRREEFGTLEYREWNEDATYIDVEKTCNDDSVGNLLLHYEIPKYHLPFPFNGQPHIISFLPEHFNTE